MDEINKAFLIGRLKQIVGRRGGYGHVSAHRLLTACQDWLKKSAHGNAHLPGCGVGCGDGKRRREEREEERHLPAPELVSNLVRNTGETLLALDQSGWRQDILK